MTLLLGKNDLDSAANLLKNGEIVAFPTETVYGLGAALFQPHAINKIFLVKGRPQDNPLIAHVSNFCQIEQIAQDLPPLFYPLFKAFFPGALTCIVPRRDEVPKEVSAGLPSIALRMPSHPIARQLIECLKEPIVAPSANLSGRPSATCADHVLHDFSGKIAAIIDGGSTPFGLESTVISLIGERPVLLRPGAISAASIESIIGQPLIRPSFNQSETPSSPGMKYRHYAPQTPIHLFYKEEELYDYLESRKQEGIYEVLSQKPLSKSLPVFCVWKPLNEPSFYSYLREADHHGREGILIFCDTLLCENEALMNRITKAANRHEPVLVQ